MLFISLVTMDHFCKTNIKTDLSMLHYVVFIGPLTVSPMEVLSFDSEQFMNSSNNKVIEAKIIDHFILLEEYFIAAVLLYKKI
jgi:hypothetical protein